MLRLAINATFVMMPVIAMADQSVYIDQTGEDFILTITQQSGDGNAIGDASNQSPYFVFDGDGQNVTITQSGDNNSITGSVEGDDITWGLTTTGDNNLWVINAAMAGYSNLDFNITGDSNDFTFNMGQSVSSQYTNLTYDIIGDDNILNWTIDADGVVHDVDITGDDNSLTYIATGYGTSLDGHTVTADLLGSNNAITITQETTTTASNINLAFDGSNQIISITQSD